MPEIEELIFVEFEFGNILAIYCHRYFNVDIANINILLRFISLNEAIGNHSFEIEDNLIRKLDDLLITSTNNTLLEEATNCISNIILERKRQNQPMDDEYVLENIYQIRLSLEAPETDYQNSILISTCKKMIPEISRLDEHATKEILELLITQSHHTRALELICYIVWTNTHLADKDFTERIWNILESTTR